MIVEIRPTFDMQTRLCDIPRDWLKHIEGNIIRMGEHWYWQGTCDKGRYPLLWDPRTKKMINARRYVAKLFWEMSDNIFVVMTCGEHLCLRPGHMHPTDKHPRWVTDADFKMR